MADRTVRVRLEAIIGPYQQAMAQAAETARRVAGEVDRLGHSGIQAAQRMQPLGTAMLGVGTAIAAAGALAVKTAIDYETAFAGVRKTTDATESQFAALSEGIRAMSRDMPASATEIARVAEAAGQLGVRRESLLSFTETMVMLGETTNLTADQAATAMARVANIMQIPQSEVERLGSTLVELGNNGASTESEILDMATRIASAGRQIGLTGSDVLAFANALSSVGIESEAGGTAISRVMIEVQNAVMEGGASLESFAKIAGQTTAQFSQSFAQAPAETIVRFIEGLRQLDDAGGNVNAVLEDLGLADIRVANALRAAAGAGDLFRDSLITGAKAYEDNLALTEEYEKRTETTAAQLSILRNRIVDVAISFGTAMLPAIKAVADILGAFVEGFAALPGPVQLAVAAGAALVGTLTLVGGGFLFLLPRILETQVAFATLAAEAPLVAAGLRGVLLAAGGIGAVLAVATAAVTVFGSSSHDSAQDAKDFAAALEQQAQGAEHAVQALVAKKIVDQDLDRLARQIGLSTADVARAILGDAAAFDQLVEQAGAWNEIATNGTDSDRRRAEAANTLLSAVRGLNGEYESEADKALRVATAQDEAGASTEDVGEAAGEAAVQVDTLAEKFDKLLDAAFGAQQASDRFTTDLLAFVDGVKAAQIEGDRYATSLDATNEQGLRNRETLRGLIGDLFDYAGSTGASAEQTALMRGQLVEVLSQLGFNRTEAQKFVGVLDQLGGMTVTPKVGLDTSAADAGLSWIERRLNRVSIWGHSLGGGGAATGGTSDASSIDPFLAGEGPDAQAALERRQRDQQDAARQYLDAVHDQAEERKRLEETTTRYLEALYKHSQDLEDNQYELGRISKDRYLEILRERLRGLEEYSDAWTAVMRQINQITGEAAEAELKILQAYEQGRAYQRSWDALLGQRLTSAQSYSSTSTTTYGPTYSPVMHITTSDPVVAGSTANQRLRDYAAAVG